MDALEDLISKINDEIEAFPKSKKIKILDQLLLADQSDKQASDLENSMRDGKNDIKKLWKIFYHRASAAFTYDRFLETETRPDVSAPIRRRAVHCYMKAEEAARKIDHNSELDYVRLLLLYRVTQFYREDFHDNIKKEFVWMFSRLAKLSMYEDQLFDLAFKNASSLISSLNLNYRAIKPYSDCIPHARERGLPLPS